MAFGKKARTKKAKETSRGEKPGRPGEKAPTSAEATEENAVDIAAGVASGAEVKAVSEAAAHTGGVVTETAAKTTAETAAETADPAPDNTSTAPRGDAPSSGWERYEEDGCVFVFDRGKTEEYYKSHSLCSCGHCRNFYRQIGGRFPVLEEFLALFGADITRPDETLPMTLPAAKSGDAVEYISVDYTVCGKVEKTGTGEITLFDGRPFKIAVTDGFASPNEQTGDYFTLSVENVVLPWEEPPAEEISAEKLSTEKNAAGARKGSLLRGGKGKGFFGVHKKKS